MLGQGCLDVSVQGLQRRARALTQDFSAGESLIDPRLVFDRASVDAVLNDLDEYDVVEEEIEVENPLDNGVDLSETKKIKKIKKVVAITEK